MLGYKASQEPVALAPSSDEGKIPVVPAREWSEPEGDFGASTRQSPIWSMSAMTKVPTPMGADCRALLPTGFVWISSDDIDNR